MTLPVTGSTLVVPFAASASICTVAGSSAPSTSVSLLSTSTSTAAASAVDPESSFATGAWFSGWMTSSNNTPCSVTKAINASA